MLIGRVGLSLLTMMDVAIIWGLSASHSMRYGAQTAKGVYLKQSMAKHVRALLYLKQLDSFNLI